MLITMKTTKPTKIVGFSMKKVPYNHEPMLRYCLPNQLVNQLTKWLSIFAFCVITLLALARNFYKYSYYSCSYSSTVKETIPRLFCSWNSDVLSILNYLQALMTDELMSLVIPSSLSILEMADKTSCMKFFLFIQVFYIIIIFWRLM